MSLLSKIFDFIKGQLTRPGLHTFLKRYQAVITTKLSELAESHDPVGLNEWWDDAFAAIRALLGSDVQYVKDNWIAIAINLAWEVIKAERERRKHTDGDDSAPTPAPIN